MKDVLILGIGNILHKDDGIGVYVVNHILESGMSVPEDADIVDGGTAGHDLIPLMKGYKKIIIVDALKANDVPGSVYRFSPDHLDGRKQLFSFHDFGIREILQSLRIMGENPVVEIIGIVPEDIDTLDIGISDSLRESLPQVVREVLNAAAC